MPVDPRAARPAAAASGPPLPGRGPLTPDEPTEAGPAASVIVAGARTPMGRLLGALKGFSGADLGGVAIKGALSGPACAGRSST